MNKFTTLPGLNSLPEPLTLEEEKKILQKLATSELESRNILVERNLRLVVYLAKKFERSVPIEELFSIGCIGLTKAANTFCVEKNIKFATYASRCIENEMLMYLRKNKKHAMVASLEVPLSIDKDGNELRIEDITPDFNSQITFEEYENKELFTSLINFALNSMSYLDTSLILYRINGFTQKNIAERFGFSQSHVSRKLSKSFNILKRSAEKTELPKSKKIVFSFQKDYYHTIFLKEYLSNIDKMYFNFLSSYKLSSDLLCEQGVDYLSFYSKCECILFAFLADFLFFLHRSSNSFS